MHGEQQAADIGVERLIGMFLGDLTKFAKLVKTGVDKEHVHPVRLNLHGFANAINVGKIIDIALYGGDVAFDRRDRVIELRLAAASDEDSSAFVGETLSGAKANAGTDAGHNCYFVFEFSVHESIYL